MKNIKSLKVAAQAFTLRNLIHLYKMCHSGSHVAHNEKEYLIVVEGTKASQLIEKFQNLIEPAEREAL